MRLLRSDDIAVCGCAAGAIQNASREAASQVIIHQSSGATANLAALMWRGDGKSRVCAAGALANVLGGGPRRDGRSAVLRRILSSTLALATVWDLCGGETDVALTAAMQRA